MKLGIEMKSKGGWISPGNDRVIVIENRRVKKQKWSQHLRVQ